MKKWRIIPYKIGKNWDVSNFYCEINHNNPFIFEIRIFKFGLRICYF